MPRKPKQLEKQTDKPTKDELIKMITETLTTIDKIKIDIKSKSEIIKLQQNDLKYYLNILCE